MTLKHRPSSDHTPPEHKDIPRFVWATAGALVVAVVIILVVAARWGGNAADRRETACEAAVRERNDDRSMWVWLIGDADQTNELVIEGRRQLNLRLPELQCIGDSAVATPAPSSTSTPNHNP